MQVYRASFERCNVRAKDEKMTVDQALTKAFVKGRRLGWKAGFQACQIMHEKEDEEKSKNPPQVDEKLLEKLSEEIQTEWQCSGLFEGIYYDFFIELLKRYKRGVA